jgi:hypothetical protein
LGVTEVGVEWWYWSHVWRLPRPVTWTVEFPAEASSSKEQALSEKTKQLLRFNEARKHVWQKPNGTRWQAIFLRWDAGRVAAHLAKMHTPEICLTAAGRKLISQYDLNAVWAHGLWLPFRCYVFRGAEGPVHVFYCLWEDRTGARSLSAIDSPYATRLEAVLSGRRNCGQRSLEIAIWGIEDHAEAEAALAQELPSLIR